MSREIRGYLGRHAMVQIAALAWLGIAEAAPPAGKPVFIQVQGLAPTSVGLNGFIVAGDFTEGGAFYWMPTSGVASPKAASPRIRGRSSAAPTEPPR